MPERIAMCLDCPLLRPRASLATTAPAEQAAGTPQMELPEMFVMPVSSAWKAARPVPQLQGLLMDTRAPLAHFARQELQWRWLAHQQRFSLLKGSLRVSSALLADFVWETTQHRKCARFDTSVHPVCQPPLCVPRDPSEPPLDCNLPLIALNARLALIVSTARFLALVRLVSSATALLRSQHQPAVSVLLAGTARRQQLAQSFAPLVPSEQLWVQELLKTVLHARKALVALQVTRCQCRVQLAFTAP